LWLVGTPSAADILRDTSRMARLNDSNIDFTNSTDRLENSKAVFNTSIDSVILQMQSIKVQLNTSRDLVNNASVALDNLVAYISTINGATPCGFVGNAYQSIMIEGMCDTMYTTFDSIVPGAIICLVATVTSSNSQI
jgi:hypothetical protein